MTSVLKTIRSGDDYIESLRGRDLKIYLFGELVKEPVDHPMIRPSINAVAETYDLAMREEELAAADSSITGLKVNRFLHIAGSVFRKEILTRQVRGAVKFSRSDSERSS